VCIYYFTWNNIAVTQGKSQEVIKEQPYLKEIFFSRGFYTLQLDKSTNQSYFISMKGLPSVGSVDLVG
jgi:hypothetical protein